MFSGLRAFKTRRLDEFFGGAEEPSLSRGESRQEKNQDRDAASIRCEPAEASSLNNLPPSYFISATYDGKRRRAVIKLYEPKSRRIYTWYDNTGHMPYCYTNVPPEELEKIERLVKHPGFDHFETVELYNALLDRKVKVTKVVARDPLAIGGLPRGCIRDIIPEEYPKIFGDKREVKVWEAAIKYYQCYIYDRGLAPGMIYEVKDGNLILFRHEEYEKNVKRLLEEHFKDEPEDLYRYVEMWARLLEYPAPDFRRVAVDIEVFSPWVEATGLLRVPDPREAEYPVICVSFVDSEGLKRVLILKRKGVKEGSLDLPRDVLVEFYNSEKDLLSAVFRTISEYPFLITFNGDDFDLRYLFHRAERLGFNRNDIPIELGRNICLLKHGIHIDLYKFFGNRSIQVYAFSQKYRNITLNEVARALLGKAKFEITRPISELTYGELAKYCLKDSELTLELTSFNNDLVMKLLLALTRVSRMPMEDVSRQGVSRWIRSFMQYEHRRRGMLIPNKEDIIAVKGKTATKAIIKGKKYKGAIVVEPKSGVHFNVAVMDFQSLYPSIIKVHNLGYQSILCPHKECRSNKVPDTPHWVCTKKRALESALIGSLRDLRVRWYKPKAKDKNLPKELRDWYGVIQSALKVILNASYGVFGAETFDLYCPPVAEATAAIGRSVITRTIEKARELGIEVLYGDTDSIFLKNPTKEQIKALSEWAEKELQLELDVDKVYRYTVLSSRKKNYLGVLSDGSVDVKGLTGKKRHIPLLIKKAFEEMDRRLSRVNTPADFEEALKDIRKIVRDSYMRLKRREWKDLNELAFEVVLGKAPKAYRKTTPQHVKAAMILEERGEELKAGDTIRFVKVVGEPRVKPVKMASDLEIDVDEYIKYLRSTFEQVLDALGLEFDEIIGLTRLEQFM
ncbi:DNA-directed DNA polymerase I [Candidatus Bathyarchaeota archaeon]|nr:MAG: DNA-directed DNA polymerase I [Candidatus Bathyarchaeota archaeon]